MSEAVILMAYGSPATADDIRPYFEDIRGGRPVSDEAVAELAERYRRIGGRSPLDEHTEAQRAALERELGIPVFAGMKHWQPRIADAVERALDEAGLAGFGARDPATLSGGQRARVALLRTLLAQPQALLLDEPFGKLDAALRADFRRFVFEFARRAGLPTVLVTHDAADAEATEGPVIALS